MAVDTSAVTIKINVIDPSSGQVIQNVTGNLDKLGQAGTRAGQSVRKGMEEAGVGSLSAVEKMRLVTEEAGVRLPRAMIRLAAESKLASAAINAIGPALIGLGTIQIGAMVFTQLIEGARKLWHNVLDINAATKDYNAELEKARKQDFGNTRSIDTTILRINEARRALEGYQAQAARHEQLGVGPMGVGLVSPANALWEAWMAHRANANAMDSQRQIDELNRRRSEQTHNQENLDEIRLEHAADSRLSREQQITAEKQRQHEINAENARYESEEEGWYGNPVVQRRLTGTSIGAAGGVAGFIGGIKPESIDDQIADIEAANRRGALQDEQAAKAKSVADRILQIHRQADEAEKSGIEKLKYEHQAALDDLVREHISSTAPRSRRRRPSFRRWKSPDAATSQRRRRSTPWALMPCRAPAWPRFTRASALCPAIKTSASRAPSKTARTARAWPRQARGAAMFICTFTRWTREAWSNSSINTSTGFAL